MTCPSCGQQLQAVSLGPDTAPWLCHGCARGWWDAELHAAALFDHAHNDFGRSTHDVIQAALDERDKARIRGASARPDTLPMLPTSVLKELASRPGIAAGFQRQVAAEEKRREGKP